MMAAARPSISPADGNRRTRAAGRDNGSSGPPSPRTGRARCRSRRAGSSTARTGRRRILTAGRWGAPRRRRRSR